MRSVYYGDIKASRKRKIWSKFFALMDTAIILSEDLEEQRRLLAEKEKSECRLLKILSEEEEESRKRIFCRFPRKLRSPLEKLNLGGTSDSSKFIDLNQTPTDSESTQNHLQWLSSSSVNAADSKTESCSLPLLVECNTTDESEKTEMENPPNPNLQSSLSSCLTVNTSRKRCAVKQIKRASGVKKAKVETCQQAAREPPEWIVQVRNMKGATDAKLIFEKCLFVTDVNPTQNRLSMPCNGLLRNDFLTDVESGIIEQDIEQKKKIGVEAILVNQRSEEWAVKLKRWEMKKDKANGSWNYSLVGGWNDFVKANGLKEGDNISVWSFRSSGILCFAIEKTS